MNIVDPRTVRPSELKSGDVMMVTVFCYVDKWDERIMAKIYKAPFPFDHENRIPQGPRVAEITSEKSEGFDLMRLLFPVVMYEMENLKKDRSG